jgi:bifunctional non-homologous end joining protein LigD
MLATLADGPLVDPAFVYEPKYDGIRAIVEMAPRGAPRIWSRLGNDKTAEFPELAAALEAWSKRLDEPAVLDGEIVAIDAQGVPRGFQQLQGLHRKGVRPAFRAAFIVFDILSSGARDLRPRPLSERRKTLQAVVGRGRPPIFRVGDQVPADGRELWTQALSRGWEGLVAKRANSRYLPGKRTTDWRKLKITREQEFVIGGWTDPRQSRQYFGALILGVFPDASPPTTYRSRTAHHDPLKYVGHVGTGFDEKELARVMGRLGPLASPDCPFDPPPPTNERPHWVKPALVAQVRFTEWTGDGILRHPVYLGLRDDKPARAIRRERPAPAEPPGASRAIEQLNALERARKSGDIVLEGGDRLHVTNLHKIFWPGPKLTKGDLLRYYVRVAPQILPVVADRPLVMKRSPNGVTEPFFYQHRAPDDVPPGVRIEHLEDDDVPSRLVGGNLKTLLYMAQLAAISQDPWFSRVQSSGMAAEVALDLDPMPGVSFATVLDVARWVRDELADVGVVGFPKTSGAEGLHVFIPLPDGTPYEAGRIFCQIIATTVAHKHPSAATIVRSVRARGTQVYVDYLQNVRGKTLASAYSARASEYAGVSTPLTWREVDAGVRREDFTIETVPDRVRETGDLWAACRRAKGVNLGRVLRKLEGAARVARGRGRRR